MTRRNLLRTALSTPLLCLPDLGGTQQEAVVCELKPVWKPLDGYLDILPSLWPTPYASSNENLKDGIFDSQRYFLMQRTEDGFFGGWIGFESEAEAEEWLNQTHGMSLYA